MILVVDSNEFRREKTSRYFRVDGIPSMCIDYDVYSAVTNPMITMLVNPSKEFITNLKPNSDTFYVIVSKNDLLDTLYNRFCIIHSLDCTVSTEQISRIIYDNFGYDLKTDTINHITLLDEIKDASFGTSLLRLKPTDYKILRFFLYNAGKIFTEHEIFQYMHYEGRITDRTFYSHVVNINKCCKREHREKLIYKYINGYGMEFITGKITDMFNPELNILSLQ